jgi:hypothetical protein
MHSLVPFQFKLVFSSIHIRACLCRGSGQDALARALLNITVQVDLVFEERTVQNYVVDDFDGIADLVVAGPDWWNRRQLNTFVVSGCVGRTDSPTDHWSPSRSLMEAIVSRRSDVSSM